MPDWPDVGDGLTEPFTAHAQPLPQEVPSPPLVKEGGDGADEH